MMFSRALDKSEVLQAHLLCLAKTATFVCCLYKALVLYCMKAAELVLVHNTPPLPVHMWLL